MGVWLILSGIFTTPADTSVHMTFPAAHLFTCGSVKETRAESRVTCFTLFAATRGA